MISATLSTMRSSGQKIQVRSICAIMVAMHTAGTQASHCCGQVECRGQVGAGGGNQFMVLDCMVFVIHLAAGGG